MVSPLPRSETPAREKLMAASIAAAKEDQKRPIVMEPSRQDYLKKVRTSSGSIVSNACPRPKLSVSQRSDELALEVLSMLPPNVLTITTIFYKF